MDDFRTSGHIDDRFIDDILELPRPERDRLARAIWVYNALEDKIDARQREEKDKKTSGSARRRRST